MNYSIQPPPGWKIHAHTHNNRQDNNEHTESFGLLIELEVLGVTPSTTNAPPPPTKSVISLIPYEQLNSENEMLLKYLCNRLLFSVLITDLFSTYFNSPPTPNSIILTFVSVTSSGPSPPSSPLSLLSVLTLSFPVTH